MSNKWNLNKVIVKGNLTRDVELRQNQNGNSYAIFTIAQNSGEQVNYIPCLASGKTAEALANYTQKGTPLLIEGSLNTFRTNDVDRMNVIASSIEFLATKAPSSQAEEAPVAAPVTNAPSEKQLALAKRLGIDPANKTKSQLSAEISAIIDAVDEEVPTVKVSASPQETQSTAQSIDFSKVKF